MRGSNQFQFKRALLLILTSLPSRENLTNEGSILVRTTMHFSAPWAQLEARNALGTTDYITFSCLHVLQIPS